MMGKFKAGDEIRALTDGRTADGAVHFSKGATFTVFSVEPDTYTGVLDTQIVTRHSRYETGWVSSQNFVLAVDFPPEVFDPSKVKAGDTVTVRIEEEYAHTKHPAYTISDTTAYGDPVMVGPFVLDQEHITLLDHQPAPEPFPTARHAVIRAKVANGDTRTLSLFWPYDRPEPERVWMDSLVVGGGSFSDADILAFEVLFPGVVAP